MKKILVLLSVAFSANVFACGGYIDFPKWSVSVIGMGNYGTVFYNWKPYFLPGIQINRKMGNYELRFAVEHTKFYNEPLEIGGTDVLFTNGPERSTTFRVGVERTWNLCKWFSPYAAVDLAGQKKYSDIYYNGGLAGLNEEHEITTHGLGLLPTIGFKTHIARHVALFAEYRAEAYVNNVYDKPTYYNGNVDARPNKQTSFDFNVGRMGNVGLQFTF